MAQICVIGGGIAGMSVAARLAAKRHEVTVIEASERLGGQVGITNNTALDVATGPTLLTLPAVYRDLFLKTGRPLEDELELTELEPGYSYHFADATRLTLPGGSVGRTVQTIADQMGSDAAAGWETLTSHGAATWRDLRQIWTQPSLGTSDRRTRTKPSATPKDQTSRRNLYLLAKHLFTDPRMVQVISRYAGRNGWDPRQAPPSLAVLPFIEQTFGLWQVEGGMTNFASALHRRCTSLGVQFLTGSAATRIRTTTGEIRGVELADGTLQAAEIVVGALPAQTLYSQLLRNLAPARTVRKIERLPQAHARFVLRLTSTRTAADTLDATESMNQPPAQHHVWFARSSIAEYDEIASGQPANQPAIYGHRAPGAHNGDTWQFVVNAPNPVRSKRPYTWSAERSAAYADHLLKLLAARGLDLVGSTQQISTTSPADFHALGQSFGYTPRGRKAPWRQPGNATGVQDVYALGNDAHPGYGLAQAGLSAEIVADLIGKA